VAPWKWWGQKELVRGEDSGDIVVWHRCQSTELVAHTNRTVWITHQLVIYSGRWSHNEGLLQTEKRNKKQQGSLAGKSIESRKPRRFTDGHRRLKETDGLKKRQECYIFNTLPSFSIFGLLDDLLEVKAWTHTRWTQSGLHRGLPWARGAQLWNSLELSIFPPSC